MTRRKHMSDHSKTTTPTLIRKPKSLMLINYELSLFEKAGITVPSSKVLVWKKISLPKFTVSSQLFNTSKKRNNSVITYLDSKKSVHWGIVEKLVSFNHGATSIQSPQCYGIITQLETLPNQICKDQVTHAQMQNHLVICQPPRLVGTYHILTCCVYILISILI